MVKVRYCFMKLYELLEAFHFNNDNHFFLFQGFCYAQTFRVLSLKIATVFA